MNELVFPKLIAGQAAIFPSGDFQRFRRRTRGGHYERRCMPRHALRTPHRCKRRFRASVGLAPRFVRLPKKRGLPPRVSNLHQDIPV